MMIPDTPAARLARAKAYPFGHPDSSYLFRGGRAEPLDDVEQWTKGRAPVLASGSNAAPDQLARKYADHGEDVAIAVTRVVLDGFDSVYNAHIAAYGSVPATLFPSPGTRLVTFITWLDDAALAVMHATEQPGINYHFAELSGVAAAVEGLGTLDAAFAYISVVGCLIHAGGPVALAEVPAEGRRFPARCQEEAQSLARDLCAPDVDGVDPFILENVANARLRAARGRALAATARPFAHPGFRVIAL
jgi:hypothetical protein